MQCNNVNMFTLLLLLLLLSTLFGHLPQLGHMLKPSHEWVLTLSTASSPSHRYPMGVSPGVDRRGLLMGMPPKLAGIGGAALGGHRGVGGGWFSLQVTRCVLSWQTHQG
jgi:hypothetical protein